MAYVMDSKMYDWWRELGCINVWYQKFFHDRTKFGAWKSDHCLMRPNLIRGADEKK